MAFQRTLTPAPAQGKAVPYDHIAQLLEDIDRINGLQSSEAPVSYTPTWASVGAVGFSVGNATVSGKWKRWGNQVFFDIRLVFGSTSAQGTGGTWTFTLPTTAAAATFGAFSVWILDSGNTSYSATGVLNNTTTVSLVRSDTGGNGAIGGTNTPIATWAAGDEIRISGWYWEA